MTSSLKKLEQNKYELTVEVGKEELAGYLKITEDRISQGVKIDGFRQGKAPKDMIRKEVGDKYILEEALDLALRDSLTKTLAREKLEVLKAADLKIKENTASKLVYTTVLVLFPAVSIGDLKELKIKRKEVVVDRKDMDEALEFVAASRSKFEPKDQPAEKGDRIEVDFEVTSDGLPIEGGVSKNHPLVIGDNKFIPGFEEQLIGMKQGDEKKFKLKAPKDYFHKNIAGRELDFNVKMVAVQKIVKPVINDDFARNLGRFKDLNDLEKNLSEGILQEKKGKENQRLRLEVLSGILEKSKIELPKEMVDERLNEMVAGFDNELHAKGMELSLYLAHLNKTADDLKKDWKGEAEKQVSFALLLKKIAKEKNIKPTEKEIEEAAQKMVQSMALQGELDKESLNLEALKEAVTNELTNEKVFNYLENTYIA